MEKIDREEYKRDLFERLKSSLGLKREEECFGACLGDASWWILEKSGYTAQELKLAVSQTCVLQKRPGSKKTGVVKPLCLKSVADTVKRARRTKRPETFVCPGGRHGFVYPIAQGDKDWHKITHPTSKQQLLKYESIAFIDAVKKNDFSSVSHSLEFYGVCNRCRAI